MLGNDEKRRLLLRNQPPGSSTLNGIDYVEVKAALPGPLAAGANRQLTGSVLLQLVFLRDLAAPLLPTQLRIVGGTLGLPLTVGGVFWDAASARILWVEVQPGERAPYLLSLRADASSTRVPSGFDPILSRAEVRFAPSGDADVDPLVAPPPAAPAEPPDPRIDYLARDYGALRQLLLERLAVTAKGHFDGHPADLGTLLIEALAQRGDELAYQQDAVGTEAYLGTARHRISVRRHARLLDYTLHEGCNARALVCCEVGARVDKSELAAAIALAPVQLLTRVSAAVTLAPAEAELLVLAGRAAVFELMPQGLTELWPQHNAIAFYDFGLDGASLAAGETVAALLASSPSGALQLRAGDLLIFEPTTDSAGGYAHPVRLVRVEPPVLDPLTQKTYVEIEWHAADALPAPLSLQIAGAAALLARGNVLLCDEGRTTQVELSPGTGRLPRAELAVGGLLHADPLPATAASLPAAQLVTQDPRQALPLIRCTEPLARDTPAWRPSADLLTAAAGERAFVVELDNDGGGSLRFGDGQRGRRPPGRLLATLRRRDGAPADVPAEGLAHLVGSAAFAARVRRVRNPLPAQAACPREPMEAAQLRAPNAFRTQERAITAADYAARVRGFSDVADAACVLRRYGSFDTAVICVVRQGRRSLTPDFLAELRAYLEPFRLIGHRLHISEPTVVRPLIRLTAYIGRDAEATAVQDALRVAFSGDEFPSGQRGFFHPSRFPLGQPLYLSQLLRAAVAVPGVRFLDVGAADKHRFRRDEAGATDEFARGFLAVAPLEVIRIADASAVQFLIARVP